MCFHPLVSVRLCQRAHCLLLALFVAILSLPLPPVAAGQQDDPRPFLTGDFKSCCFLGEKTLLTVSSKGELCRWDVGSATPPKRFQVVDAPLYDLSVLSGGKRVIATAGAGDNNKIVQIDLASGKAVGSVKLPSEIRRLLPTPDGKRTIAACEDATVRVYDLESGKEVMRLEAALKGKWTPELTPEDKAFLKNFPPDVQKELNKPLFSPACLDASVSSDGKTLAVTYDRIIMTPDKNVHVWDLASGKHINEFRVKGLSGGWLSFNPKKPDILLLSGRQNYSQSIAVWNPSKEEAPTVMADFPSPVREITHSPDGSMVASTCLDGSIFVTRAGERPKQLGVLPDPPLPIYELAFSHDSALLAVKAYDVKQKTDAVFIWELASGKLLPPR